MEQVERQRLAALERARAAAAAAASPGLSVPSGVSAEASADSSSRNSNSDGNSGFGGDGVASAVSYGTPLTTAEGAPQAASAQLPHFDHHHHHHHHHHRYHHHESGFSVSGSGGIERVYVQAKAQADDDDSGVTGSNGHGGAVGIDGGRHLPSPIERAPPFTDSAASSSSLRSGDIR